MSKLDIIYSFHFNNRIEETICRLKSSIDSIKNQEVNVCISNTSKNSIKEYFKDYTDINYYEEVLNIEPYCKCATTNKGIKNLVTSEYFLLSDVDILYPSNYVETMKTLIEQNKEKPIRAYPFIHCVPFKAPITYEECLEKRKISSCDDGLRHPGFAVGIGLVHLPSYNIINGFNEEFRGYGQEDSEFNIRLEYINKIIEIDKEIMCTFHMFHDYEFPRDESFHRNNALYIEKRDAIKKQLGNEKFDINKHLEYIITKDKTCS
jgi:hypothetical protein